MRAETDDGCSCPRCHDHIPEEFYCRNCGYVPDWRQRAYRHEAGGFMADGIGLQPGGSASIADSSERTVFHAKGCSLTLRRFPRCLVLLVRPLPPVRHVAAVEAVKLLGNVVVTSWAATSIVRFGFHCPPSFQICFACAERRIDNGNIAYNRPAR